MKQGALIWLVLNLLCRAQAEEARSTATPSPSQPAPQPRRHALGLITPAYRTEALQLVLEEANKVARELRLPERLPITQSDLVAAYVSPPRFRAFSPGVGNVTTTNYTYYVTIGDRFSYLVKTGLEKEYAHLEAEYRWPWSQMDTNAAYRMATQWLAAASMDVAGLNRDCRVSVSAWTPEGLKRRFIPVYTVAWKKQDSTVAMVQLVAPAKTLLQMHVERSEYILRKPVEIKNVEYLLSQTNAPAKAR